MKVGRLSCLNQIVGLRNDFILYAFTNFEPVERFQDRSNMIIFASSCDCPCCCILDVLKSVDFVAWEVEI